MTVKYSGFKGATPFDEQYNNITEVMQKGLTVLVWRGCKLVAAIDMSNNDDLVEVLE